MWDRGGHGPHGPLDLLLDNEQSETRRMEKKNNIHAERSEAGNFLKKYEIRALKFIV